MQGDSLFWLDGKIAAVIGAGSGIGAAVAEGCSRQGATVVCLDINAAAAEGTASAIREAEGASTAGALDIRDDAAVEAAFGGIQAEYGRLDIVVCTPSVNVRKPILAYSAEEFDRVVTLNLKGNFHVLRAAGRIMTSQRGGSIVLFSSIRGKVVEPGQSVYAATKAGIEQLARAAAAEFGPAGVRVNVVAPGIVDTPLTAQIKADADWYNAYAAKGVFNRWARVDEMVGPTLFLASDAASYVTGSVLYVDGGWTAVDGRFQPPGM
jgi:NAD(P)-dependent dehydrogenase (short-subunit alcohol dehydrogenase family)